MEAIDLKVQEAIASIQAHGKRIKNLIKSDPINNKADVHWKLSLQANDMLRDEMKSASKPTVKPTVKLTAKPTVKPTVKPSVKQNDRETKNDKGLKSVPLQKNPISNKPSN